MILSLALPLLAALAAPSAGVTAHSRTVVADPLTETAALRETIASVMQSDLEMRMSLQSIGPAARNTMVIGGLQQLVDATGAYVDYYLSYYGAHDAVVDAVQHAYFLNTPNCGTTTEYIAGGIGGGYVASQTFLVATLPDVNGQSTLVGSHGGMAMAQPLALMPMATPGTAQGGDPAFNHALHHYSAVLANGWSHSGVAVQVDSGGQSHLVLYPDAIVGTSLFQPGDLMTLRWLLRENAGIPASLIFDTVLPPFDPPWALDADTPLIVRTTIEEAILCCLKALMKWKKEMTDYALYDQAWARQNANENQAASDALEAEIRENLGSHAVDVVMNDGFIMDTGGMPPEEFQAQVDQYREQKSNNDAQNNQNETNRKNAKNNANTNITNKLSTAIWACLGDLPQAVEIHAAIMARPIDLVF